MRRWLVVGILLMAGTAWAECTVQQLYNPSTGYWDDYYYCPQWNPHCYVGVYTNVQVCFYSEGAADIDTATQNQGDREGRSGGTFGEAGDQAGMSSNPGSDAAFDSSPYTEPGDYGDF